MMWRDDVVSVLGGGWTAGGYDRARLPGTVVAVNDAVFHAPCNMAVTMDRLWAEHRVPDLLGHRNLQRGPGLVYVRAAAAKNLDAGQFPFLRRFDNDHTSADMCEADPVGSRLNGTNSGLCALNLAFQMRPRRVILFGFDMNRSPEGRPYFYKPYPWAKPSGATSPGKYRAWAAEFTLAAVQFERAGIEVLNASPTSDITAFEKVKPEEFLL